MRRAVLVAGLLAVGLVTPVHAEPVRFGRQCAFHLDNVADRSRSAGWMYSLPQVAFDVADLHANLVSIEMRCDFQVGPDAHYSQPDLTTVTVTGTPATAVPPTLIGYQREPGLVPSVCTTWTLTDAYGRTFTYYWGDGALHDHSDVYCYHVEAS